jgi:hypothetical protein
MSTPSGSASAVPVTRQHSVRKNLTVEEEGRPLNSLDFGLILPKFSTSVGAVGPPNLEGPAAAAFFIGLAKSKSYSNPSVYTKFYLDGLTESEVSGSPIACAISLTFRLHGIPLFVVDVPNRIPRPFGRATPAIASCMTSAEMSSGGSS